METSSQMGRLIGSIALATIGCIGCSVSNLPNASYVTDINGGYVRDGMGHCVRTIHWTEATANAACDQGLMKPVAPKVVVQPAPVVAPAPVPVPVEAAPVVAAPVVAAPVVVAKPSIIEKPVRLEGANFATGSSKLLKAADSKLDEVVNAATQYPDVQLAVAGYTDNTGNAQKNVKLSQDRANAVKAYLVSKGVATGRISSNGLGADSPIADNATKEGRAKNRRVEVRYTIKEVM